jgi:alpha-L-fucosidase
LQLIRKNLTIKQFINPSQELLLTMAQTVANGGNLLVDVGPTKEGTIPVIMQERLKEMGSFLKVNGEAIYGSSPWSRAYNDTITADVYYTQQKSTGSVYAMFINWPQNNQLSKFSLLSNFTIVLKSTKEFSACSMIGPLR